MSAPLGFPMGGGAMGRLIRETDWSHTPMGPLAAWSPFFMAHLNAMLSSPESLYLVWGPQDLFFFNDRYSAILPCPPEQAMGQPIGEIWPGAWQAVQPLAMKALAGEHTRVENQPIQVQRNGVQEPSWWSFSFTPLHDIDGAVRGVLCMTVETTEQVLATSRLKDNVAFTDRILASINDCIKVLDMDARLVFMSEGGQRIMEVADYGAIHGCPWPDFWQDQGNLEAKAAVQEAQAGRNAAFMGAARTMAGTLKWWHVQVSPIFAADGKPEKILCVSRDMTALRDAEDSLRKLNESLEQRVIERTLDRDRIWRLSADLMLVADFNGVMTAVNPAWAEMLGWAPAQLLGVQLMSLVHPDDVASTQAAMGNLSVGQSFFNFRNRYRHADGSYRTIAWTAVPDEHFIHAVGRNIQREVEADEALRVSEEALRQSQKLEAIGQLTGGVAHDFNNLLTVIKSCTDLLKSPNLAEHRRLKYVDAVSSTVDRAARLTGQLLAFARRQALQPEVFDAGESVLRIGEMMDTLTGSRIKVAIEVPPQPCFINADSSQFDTALVNMVVNARDAMGGVGELSIAVARVSWLPANRNHALRPGEYITVTIVDDGAGIEKDKLGLIFEPFYTTKGIGQGTGLGLSQVFGFAKQSGGEVLVESEVGHGTQFILYLPAALAGQLPAEPPEDPLLHRANEFSVLIVEDNPDIGTFTSMTLEQLGYDVLWVQGAEQALEVLERNAQRFHAVFSDIAMPGMTGLELYAEIEASYPWLPVVLTTGYSADFARISGEQAGQFELLQKPYSTQELVRVLQRVTVV